MLGSLLARLFGRSREPIDQIAGNDAIRAQLTAMGDDGTASRHIVHYGYGLRGAETTQDEMTSLLRDRGYRVSEAVKTPGVVFETEGAVAGAEFDTETEELAALMRERGWDYDGWECAVVQDDEEGET